MDRTHEINLANSKGTQRLLPVCNGYFFVCNGYFSVCNGYLLSKFHYIIWESENFRPHRSRYRERVSKEGWLLFDINVYSTDAERERVSQRKVQEAFNYLFEDGEESRICSWQSFLLAQYIIHFSLYIFLYSIQTVFFWSKLCFQNYKGI